MHTLLILAVLSANLTPSDELGARLAAIDHQRTAIDERRSNAQVFRGAAALGYIVSSVSFIWGLYEVTRPGREIVAQVLERRADDGGARVDRELLFATAGASLALAIAFHVGVNRFLSQLDDEQEDLDTEAKAIQAHLTKSARERWLELDGPPGLAPPP